MLYIMLPTVKSVDEAVEEKVTTTVSVESMVCLISFFNHIGNIVILSSNSR